MNSNQSTHNQRGVSALEFSIIAPLVFVLIYGIIEFGILFYDKVMITNATREGARAGIISRVPRLTDDQIQQVVLDYAQSHLITFGSNTLVKGNILIVRQDVNADNPPNSFGDNLIVTVPYQYKFLLLPNFGPLGWGSLSNPITIQAVTVMKME